MAKNDKNAPSDAENARLEGASRSVEPKKLRLEEFKNHARTIARYLEGENSFLAEAEKLGTNLKGRERRRLYGAGVRNYGFIEKAYDIARGFPKFMPKNLDVGSLRESLAVFDGIRQLVFELEQYLRAASDVMLNESDKHYRVALEIYDSLRSRTRYKYAGAEPLFRALQPFFKRRKRADGELTEKQLEKDAKKLLRGEAEGEIIVTNETPKVSRRRKFTAEVNG